MALLNIYFRERSLFWLHQWLLSFVKEKISEIDSEKIAFSLGWMIFPLKMTDMIRKNILTFIEESEKSLHLSMIDEIQRPFKRFNDKNLKSFINWGEIATILTHFPEVLIPFKLSEDEAVAFGMLEDKWMFALTY